MASSFGITLITGTTLIESVDVQHTAETKELITATGTHSEARIVDDSFTFSVKGKGTTTVTAGAATGAPTGVTGKIVITNVTASQTNDDWESFSYSGTGYTHAT
jgi:hypothetical protein